MIIEIAKNELARVRVESPPPLALAPEQARLRVATFGLTTNNITYAVFGTAMRYWDFFPTADPATWGCVPVWGFAEVVESTSPACAVGERLYGYLPMASELVIGPGRADEHGLSDLAPHRAPMAGAYNRYVRCATDPIHVADREAQQMLLYPLFFTSFVVDDFFADYADFATDRVVVSSASSKTAIGVAFLSHQRGRPVVGLTSDRHRDFVHALGVYDEVLGYDEIGPASGTAVYVDVAGNLDVRHAVHAAYGDRLAHSMVVGGTHWDQETTTGATADLSGPAPEFFFAPNQIAKRAADWGRPELDRRIGAAWTTYSAWTDGWLELRTATGAAAVTAAYSELLGGALDPRTGFVCTLPAAGEPG
ncbi:MAG: DUF2855 family protein [Acidimicrobiia bacterium]